MKIAFQKFIVGILIFSFVFLPVSQSHAFIFHDIAHTVVTSIFSGLSTASQAITNFGVGLPGTGSAAAGSFKAGKVSCNTIKKTLEAADMADLANISTAVVGEGYTKVTKLTVKYNGLKALKICLELFNTMVELGDPIVASTGLAAISSLGFNKTTLAVSIADISRKMDSVKESTNQAWADVWKAITVRLLMQAQQKITTNMVNNLIQKYKVSNYTQYANAVAGQVYNYQYLKQYSSKGSDQAIVRSLLPGGIGKASAMPMIKAKADKSFGQKVDLVDLDDPNFFAEMAKKGSSNANPSFQEYLAESGAMEVASKSQAKASEEISTNNGFKGSWDCKESRQQTVDAETAKLSKEAEIAYIAYDDLLTMYELDSESVDYFEVQMAEEAYNLAKGKMETYAEAEKDGVSPCELLNPGSVISNSTNNYLASHLSSTANMKDANLPFFAKFIESTASNLLNNIIGKTGRGFNSLAENGSSQVKVNVSDVVETNKSTQSLKADFEDAQRDNIIFEGVKTGAEANEYKLQWDAENYVGADNASNSFVEINGPLGLSKKFNDLKGTMIIGNPKGGTYNLKVTVNGQVVTIKTWTMPEAVLVSVPTVPERTVEEALFEAEVLAPEAAAPYTPPTEPGNEQGGNTQYIQLCQAQYVGNQTMIDECIAAQGVGYVLGASTKMQILLREASGVAAKFFFLK